MGVVHKAKNTIGPCAGIINDPAPDLAPLPEPVVTLVVLKSNVKSHGNTNYPQGLEWDVYKSPTEVVIECIDQGGPKHEENQVQPGIP
jgi:hypothetical protein